MKGRGGGRHREFRNNLVCTKRQKDIYANRKHETTTMYPNEITIFEKTIFDVSPQLDMPEPI